ncbi:acylglycerone-phosphate reductase [Sugiyamaella lignohabitans]|uniref:Acylglycerone-phosphate reductase n=1 Tax=Sugiyamaella lignohabitans TaxID=796027 RepID=A0A167DT70_9ASCO|nr:acylglycerone-phosphate reductase [Sugiyamaella lignohabitans]ANB13268.1 acylglycerone-phosphate reductase [Sugiyamaella lignohabitans]
MDDLKALGVNTFRLDVTDQESVNNAKELIIKETGGRLDYLINNAGQPCTMPAIDASIEMVQQVFDVNFHGVVRMTNAFSQILIASKGKIIQIGSVAGIFPFPWGAYYGATKAALHQYSSVLRLELKPFDVDVVTIVTGGVHTNISDDRDIPEGSLYIDAEEGIQDRRRMARNNQPMSSDEYAKRVFRAINKPVAPEQLWEGSYVTLLRFFNSYMPRWFIIFVLSRKFGLYEFYAKVRARYSKKNI